MRVKPTLIEWLVIVASIGVLAGLLIPTADFDLTHRYPALTSPHLSGPKGVAGAYYQGYGRGWNLYLSILADGRYSLISSTCTGVDHRESGFVQESKGQYVLSPSESGQPSIKIKRNFVLIRWGQRHYLIPPDDMKEFREEIINGREPRDEVHGSFYLRTPIAPADGLPDSPLSWANVLREGLLLGRVTAVSTVGLAKVGRATVNLGAKEGIRKGDVLTVQRHSPSYFRRLLVVSVMDHSCVADEGLTDPSERPLEPGLAVVAVETVDKQGLP